MADGRPGAVVLDDDTAALIRQMYQRRLSLKKTRREIGFVAGLTERAICKIESQTVNVKVGTLLRYAAALGCRLVIEEDA